MIRRHFLRHAARMPLYLVGLALASRAVPGNGNGRAAASHRGRGEPPTPSPTYTLLETPIAGWQHHDGDRVYDRLNEKDRLELRREPDNPHDHRAVAVYRKGAKLGYIPRTSNHTIARLLDQQAPLTAHIKAKHPGPDPWKRVVISVGVG